MGNSKWIRIAVIVGIALFGIALLFNPFYLVPDGGSGYEQSYQIRQIENETTAGQALGLSEDVLDCEGERPCVLEQHVLEEGPVETDIYVDDSERRYSVVKIGMDMYIPEEQVEENVTVLLLEEVSKMEAVEHAAVPAEERPDEVREAIESGSITVHGEQIEGFERGEIYEYNGEYYHQYGGAFRAGTDYTLFVVRVLLILLGSGLIAFSGWRLKPVLD